MKNVHTRAFANHRMHARLYTHYLHEKRKIVELYYAKFYLHCGIKIN